MVVGAAAEMVVVDSQPRAWQQTSGKSTPMSRILSGGSVVCSPDSGSRLDRAASQPSAGTTTRPPSADIAKWKKVTVTVRLLSRCRIFLVSVSLSKLSETHAAKSVPTSSATRALLFSPLLPSATATSGGGIAIADLAALPRSRGVGLKAQEG
jgi:hypothetical protein